MAELKLVLGSVRRKYRNVPVVIDDMRFDSKAEGARYQALKLLVQAGEIAQVQIHPRFQLRINDVDVATYVGDFGYVTKEGQYVVEDVKGMKTPAYRIKKRLMKALHRIEIREVRA